MRRHLVVLLMMAAGLIAAVGWKSPAASGLQACCPFPRGSAEHAVHGKITPMPPVDTSEVRKQFNGSSGKVRIVALLSPMCPECESGHALVGRVLKKFPSPELNAILIWEPMRSDDSAVAATQQAKTAPDVRIWQGWNENRNVGKLFGETLGLHGIAWDVYLVYKPGIQWTAQQPPAPTFWMHQLAGADPKLLLCQDPTRLSAEVAKLLHRAG